MKKKRSEFWLKKPENHDYAAARDYLSLLFEAKRAAAIVSRLRRAPISHYKVKDILRASRLPILERDNSFVASDLKKARKGVALSPVLLVRGDATADVPLIIADGYHRICASWYVDENVEIPCHVAGAM
jgi:hypothetical protein